MTDPFARPSNDFFAAKNFPGKLALFENIGQPNAKMTKHSKPNEPTPYITADVTVIDADGGVAVFPQSDVFGMALVGTLSRAVPGKPLLGRLKKGVSTSNPDNPPWILEDYTDADAAIAGQYLTQRAAGSFSSPAAAAPATTPAPAAPPPAAPVQQSAIDVNDPAVQAALAALAASGVAATPGTDSPPF
jgi:hypothetical protein